MQKSTEPIQPQALLKFPKIYKPKPSATSPEVISYSENAVTSEKVLIKADSCDQGIEEDKVTAHPRQGKTSLMKSEYYLFYNIIMYYGIILAIYLS